MLAVRNILQCAYVIEEEQGNANNNIKNVCGHF